MLSAEQIFRTGVALQQQGNYAGALAAFDASLHSSPQVAPTHYNRGNCLAMLGRLEEAIAAYDRCLELDSENCAAQYNRANALIHLHRYQDALNTLDEIARKYPGLADAWNNRAGVLQALGRNPEALESMQKVLALRPSDARSFYNAGVLCLTLNRFDEAQQALARALELEPRHPDILGHLASAAVRACDWDGVEKILPSLLNGLKQGNIVVPTLTLLALVDEPMLQKACAERNLARNLAGPAPPKPMALHVHDHPKIRIGYLSSDFGDHPVAEQIAPLLERHDRSRFEIVGFFTGREGQSAGQRRIAHACDQFLSIGAKGTGEGAALIREKEIDILVDLNGQTQGWRPAILRHRPAPVIASYLGYAGTTGGGMVDYIIGDPWVTPFELAPAFAENIVQLPNSFWAADPDGPAPAAMTRAELGLPPDAFVFCCFNANHKIRPAIFDVWMRLLIEVPHSVLWMRDGGSVMSSRFRHQAHIRGVDPARLYFTGRMESRAHHLGRQAQADIFLDTWPYNAHATAIDALSAGLPLITLRGQSFASRIAAGFLANLDLEELIADTLEAYQSLALTLAREPERLRLIRERLAQARKKSKLFDISAVARHLEAAFVEMHRRARCGEVPGPFGIS